MLNILVDKALQRSEKKIQNTDPIFTISYSSMTPKKSNEEKIIKAKSAVNKIHKNNKRDENIFQKWKSKTLQKLKDLNTESRNYFNESKNQKTNQLKQKSSSQKMQLNFDSVMLEQMKQQKRSFIVHKRKLTSKTLSLKPSDSKSPSKSIYLIYKDQKNQKKTKFNKNLPLNHLYQRKIMEINNSNRQESNIVKIAQNQDQNKYMSSTQRKVSFFNTIQYRTVPKDQIKHYKAEQFEFSKKSIFNKTEQSFRRNIRSNNGPYKQIINNSAFGSEITEFQNSDLIQKTELNHINMRDVYTQKRSRRIFNESIIKNPEKQQLKTVDNYRPWSPIKTNPALLFVNEDELLFQQSRSFNIFCNISGIQDT